MTSTYDHYWEQWVASSAPPQEVRKKHARRYQRDDHTWITYHDTIGGQHVIVDMPTNASTATCHRGRHDHCPHRLGQPQEGGIWFPAAPPPRRALALRMPLPQQTHGRRTTLLTLGVRAETGTRGVVWGPVSVCARVVWAAAAGDGQ